MSSFCYNEKTRVHTLDGVIIPSVSQIIKPLTDYSMIPPKVLERKCQLGINFHKAIELHMLDDLCMDSLDPDLIKPMETFIEWDKVQTDRDSAEYEKPLYHPILKYCGKPDRVNDDSIVDFKLRPYNPISDPLQMAGYGGFIIPDLAVKRMVLSFDIKGGLKIHDARNSQAWSMFVAMLTHYKRQQGFNKLLEGWKGACKNG